MRSLIKFVYSKAGPSASNVDNLLNSRTPGSRASTPPTPGRAYSSARIYACIAVSVDGLQLNFSNNSHDF